MNFLSVRTALPAAVTALLLGVAVHPAAAAIRLVFENDSGYADADVYIGFVGGAGTQLAATNAATGAPLSLSRCTAVAPAPCDPAEAHWYTLDQLPRGINLTTFVGGRIYVGYGTPWRFLNAGYEPPPSNPTDPNYLLRFDKMELTVHPDPADVADTTSFDYFSIPLGLNVYRGGTSGTLVGQVTASTTDDIVSALGAATTPAGAAVVTDGTGNFVRVIGPGKYPPPPGLPASPYDKFDAYLGYLHDSYAPNNGGVIARIAGHFNGVGTGGTPATDPQDYSFTATIDAARNITLTGSGTAIGSHTLLFKYADLVGPLGVYGANPAFSIDGVAQPNPLNDIYGWLTGDLLAGLNIGAIGSMVTVNGAVAGQMNSQDWFTQLDDLFSALQPLRPNYYNQWAAALDSVSEAYGFAYSDRFACCHVVVPLNPNPPQSVDTLQIVFMPDHRQMLGCAGGRYSRSIRSCGTTSYIGGPFSHMRYRVKAHRHHRHHYRHFSGHFRHGWPYDRW